MAMSECFMSLLSNIRLTLLDNNWVIEMKQGV
jgi:hypothetical protein